MITEDQLEQLAIQWFQDTGWNHVHGAVIAPEGVAAEREALITLTPALSQEEREKDGRLAEVRLRVATPGRVRRRDAMPGQVLDVMTKPEHPSLVQSNRAFHRLRLDGKPWFHFAIAA
jgi:type I restriction enzyme R subunit